MGKGWLGFTDSWGLEAGYRAGPVCWGPWEAEMVSGGKSSLPAQVARPCLPGEQQSGQFLLQVPFKAKATGLVILTCCGQALEASGNRGLGMKEQGRRGPPAQAGGPQRQGKEECLWLSQFPLLPLGRSHRGCHKAV